ncbi:MAG: hypothetical protein ACSHYA_18205 [Opitutaceae bacterium]
MDELTFTALALLVASPLSHADRQSVSVLARSTPLILSATAEQDVAYKVYGEHDYESIKTYKVSSIEKDILSDFEITQGQEIIVHETQYDTCGLETRTPAELVKARQSAQTPAYSEPKEEILFLTIGDDGEWRKANNPYRRFDKATIDEPFEPVGIDGKEVNYTINEWKTIAQTNVPYLYYSLDFADPRPVGWPNTLEEAITLTVKELRSRERVPLISKTYYNEIYSQLGLPHYNSQSDKSSQINKALLMDLGRVEPGKARHSIICAAEKIILAQPYSFAPDTLKSQKLERLECLATPLEDAIRTIFEQVQLTTSYKLEFSPETSDAKINIRLRKLDSWRCLQFVLQQVDCAIDVSSATDAPLTFYIYRERP